MPDEMLTVLAVDSFAISKDINMHVNLSLIWGHDHSLARTFSSTISVLPVNVLAQRSLSQSSVT